MVRLHDQKQVGKERGFFALVTLRWGKQGRNLEAGMNVETTEECCLMVCSPWLPCGFAISSRTICPGVALPTVGWTLTSTINQENALQTRLGASLMEAFSLLIIPLPSSVSLKLARAVIHFCAFLLSFVQGTMSWQAQSCLFLYPSSFCVQLMSLCTAN